MTKKRDINNSKWHVWVTDKQGQPVPDKCKYFDKKDDAVNHAKDVYEVGGRGRNLSTYLFPPSNT